MHFKNNYYKNKDIRRLKDLELIYLKDHFLNNYHCLKNEIRSTTKNQVISLSTPGKSRHLKIGDNQSNQSKLGAKIGLKRSFSTIINFYYLNII